MRRQQRGFTLIEVFLAVSIFAVISLASFSIFDGVMKSEQSSQDKVQRLNGIQSAFLVIERDFLQIAQRSMRLEGEAPNTEFIYSSTNSYSMDDQDIAFVRAGWSNPGLLIPRSDMQSVAYRVTDNQLQRLHFNFVDAITNEDAKDRALLTNVNAVKFEFFDGDKWLKAPNSNEIPPAIAIIIDHADVGEIRRQFLLPGGVI